MARFKLSGTVFFQHLGTGAWGIRDAKGQEWRPVNFPAQLKHEGAQVEVTAQKVAEDFSIYMWGEPVEIVSFDTLQP
jgi:hypothetical protein